MGGWEKFNLFSIWMLKAAYLNILWIGFTFLGLGLFGLFPSTGAMFAITRKWLQKEPVENIFSAFWNVYKKEFFILNKFGLFFIVIGYILVYDFLFLNLNGIDLQFLLPLVGCAVLSYIITLLYFFPVYNQFELKFFQYIKQSFLIGATCIVETVLLFVTVIVLMVLVRLIPGIIPLFTGSVLALSITWCSNRALRKIAARKNMINSPSS
ncbi:YesL family protein [Bacillus infantis]|uniref:YesL family protein n=1 Tax=Bacillus infantis TaxID=324767 RepID=UPI003CF50C92